MLLQLPMNMSPLVAHTGDEGRPGPTRWRPALEHTFTPYLLHRHWRLRSSKVQI
jgi:hypothetical protein